MKDSEFIELLNLYLDHEISAADAARLEAEVQSNPDRRRVYREYCQMQKACKVLAEDFVEESAAEQKIVAFESARRRARTGNLYLAGTFAAAAACAAVIFVGRQQQTPTPTGAADVAVTAPAPASTPSAIATTVSVPSAHRAPTIQPAMMTNGLSLTDSKALLASSAAQADAHFAWMHNLQLPPLQQATAGQLRFDANVNRPTESHTYTSGQAPVRNDVEWIAIRYQK
jgi:hypothetical protein